MSVAEMKAKALSQLEKLQKEDDIKEILMHLEKLEQKEKSLNLSQHYEQVKEQYGDVLNKLAQ